MGAAVLLRSAWVVFVFTLPTLFLPLAPTCSSLIFTWSLPCRSAAPSHQDCHGEEEVMALRANGAGAVLGAPGAPPHASLFHFMRDEDNVCFCCTSS